MKAFDLDGGGTGRSCAEVLEQALARSVDAAIAPQFAHALTEQVRRERPRLVVEVGMANGISTLAILCGLEAGARLISIDPFQAKQWDDAGLRLVASTDRAGQHELLQEPNYHALPNLLQKGLEVDFAYIDGMHTFDYVALDAFYLDKLLRVGGILAFNDCGFRSVHKFLRMFTNHRRYQELDVGLSADYRGANPLITLARRIEGRSNQDRYFRKLDRWEPEHNFFRRF